MLLVAVASIVYLDVRILLAIYDGKLSTISWASSWWAIALATIVYLGGHLLRILRLALLVGSWRVGLRTIGSFHLMSVAVSLIAPLKLGEVYRVIELSNIAGNAVRAIIIVWWERVFDVTAILLLLLVALSLSSGSVAPEFHVVALLALAFVLVTGIVVALVPENLRRLSVFIIRRYDSPKTVPLLQILDVARRSIAEAPGVVRRKTASLATLTLLIWLCEAVCFAILFPTLRSTFETTLHALLAFLSTITLGETLLTGLDRGADDGSRLLTYLSASQIPLAFVGLAGALHYASRRFRRSSPQEPKRQPAPYISRTTRKPIA